MSKEMREYSGSTDEELVAVARAGREAGGGGTAAAELFGRYERAVYLCCYRYVNDHERALDLSQDVFLRAWQGLESFAGRSKFSSWLFAITRNRCINEVRRVDLLHDEGIDPEYIPGREAWPDRELEEREGEEKVLRLVRETLDPLEQKAIWMRCFERLPVDEITRLLGIEVKSGARGMLQTARRKLKAALEEG